MNANQDCCDEPLAATMVNESESMKMSIIRDDNDNRMEVDNHSVEDSNGGVGIGNDREGDIRMGEKQFHSSTNDDSIESDVKERRHNNDDNGDDGDGDEKMDGTRNVYSINFNYDEKVTELVASLDALQARMDDVIAFPTASNFKKMLHQASSTHSFYTELSRRIEFGDMKNSKKKDDVKSNHDDGSGSGSGVVVGNITANITTETKASLPKEEEQSIVLDEGTRGKLTSFGTNIWLNIQNNPELFLDFIPSQSSSDVGAGPSTGAGDAAQDPSSNLDSSKVQANELDKERAGASGYIRSLACRLILVAKIQTRDLLVPKLICKKKSKKVKMKTKSHSNSYEVVDGETESAQTSVPIASRGELEFAFKCLYRAGRAIMHHSYSSSLVSTSASTTATTMMITASSSTSIPNAYDPSTAYTTLSLALNVWECIGQLQKSNRENGKTSSFTDDAFDVMLSLPDCAILMVRVNRDKDVENIEIDNNISGCCDDNTNATEHNQNNDAASLVLKELKRLEEFANSKVSCRKDKEDELKSIQYFLPSVARISYKHGNRLARLSNFSSSREALRIALCSTDKCLGIIRENIKLGVVGSTKVHNSAIQIQEQEMLVLSKQSFYVLSHVCQSTGKIDEAKKCLDQIELYINEQVQKDEEQYKETIRRISKSNLRETENFAGLSGFALEGPKKQDMAEIRNRVTSARGRAKYGEMVERINLAYSRIMMDSSDNIVEEDEKLKDVQFQLMVELTKEIETNKASYKPEPHSQTNSYAFPMNRKDALDLTLSAARSIFLRREINCINHRYRDPYGALCTMFSNIMNKNIRIRLEFLNTMLFVVEDIRDREHSRSKYDISSIDKRVLDTGKEVMSQLMIEIAPSISNGKSDSTKSTLFRNNRGESGLDISRMLSDSRQYFTRAVSLYFSSLDSQSRTAEWCDLLVEVLRASQQHSYTYQKEEVQQERSDHVISEILATKALSLSMTNCHGAALKAAREAWEKYGAEVGNLVTLFHCSVQYEAFSDNDDPKKHTFDLTLIELDNTISSFLSLSKLLASAEVNYEKLLGAFPVMCNTASQIEKNQTGPLLLGLQERYLNVLMDFLSFKISQGTWDFLSTSEGGKVDDIPGENNMFDVLTAYLANFDGILSSDSEFNQKWYCEKYQHLQKVLDIALKGLILVRDQSKKDDNSLLEFSAMLNDSQPHISDKGILLFENQNVRHLIGSSADCLWTAEQLWNIATQIMSKDFGATKEEHSIRPRLHAAELYSKAHDFALFSEEECGVSLTTGYIAFENFDTKRYNPTMIDFKTSAKFDSTDICSEFSAQCLLLMVAHIIDEINDQEGTNTTALSTDHEQLLNRTLSCLIAAMSEMYILGTQVNETISEQIIWLALSLLIALRNDELCSNTLTNGGLLYRLEADLLDKVGSGGDVGREDPTNPLFRIFLLSTRSEHFGMRLTTKLLLTLCANDAIKRGFSNIGKDPSNSIGSIQRTIINLSSTVEDAVAIFNAVDEQVKRGPKNLSSLSSSSSQSSNKSIFPYTSEDIDYFVIEAHNRAVSLLYIGDLINAEKLLTVSLNLLPYSGKEVERHGAEVRKVYRGVIEKRCNGDRIISMSSENMISLFDERSA